MPSPCFKTLEGASELPLVNTSLEMGRPELEGVRSFYILLVVGI